MNFRSHSQSGQGSVEYALIIVLVAVVVILFLNMIGDFSNNSIVRRTQNIDPTLVSIEDQVTCQLSEVDFEHFNNIDTIDIKIPGTDFLESIDYTTNPTYIELTIDHTEVKLIARIQNMIGEYQDIPLAITTDKQGHNHCIFPFS
jgi:hypothetical protein